MAENETVTVITESRNLMALPFRPSEDQISTGKVWEDWLEGIERAFSFSKIINPQDKKAAMIIFGDQEISRLEKNLPDSTEVGFYVYEKLRKKPNDYVIP